MNDPTTLTPDEDEDPMREVRCPNCRHKLAELRDSNGYRIRCPKCGAMAKRN